MSGDFYFAKLFLALHNIFFLLTRRISPLDIGELAIEMSLDARYTISERSGIFVVELIPACILHESIETSGLIAFLRTES